MASRDDDQDPTARLRHLEVEVPATPEQVWQAIATGEGNAAWLFPAEIEGREGGAMVIHREPYGEDATATVTTWDPPHRFAFDQPLAGAAAPLATEFLVEARAGGTCIVRVVSGFRRDGGGWEELVDGAGEGWRMALLGLRTHLAHAAGQPGAPIDVTVSLGRPAKELDEVAPSVLAALGLAGLAVGDVYRAPHTAPPLVAAVEHAAPHAVIMQASVPSPALVALSVFPMDGAVLSVNLTVRLYGPDRTALARRDQPRWQAWVTARASALATSTTTTTP